MKEGSINGPPKTPSPAVLCEVFQFMNHYINTDTDKILECLPKPSCDRVWARESYQIRRDTKTMKKQIEKMNRELENVPSKIKNIDARETKEVGALMQQINTLQTRTETRKRKYQEERNDQKTYVDAVKMKRSRVCERLVQRSTEGTHKLRVLKRRHYRGFFGRLARIYSEDHPAPRYEDPGETCPSPYGSFVPGGLGEPEEEVVETGMVGEPLLDVNQVSVCMDNQGRQAHTPQQGRKGPLFHSAPPSAGKPRPPAGCKVPRWTQAPTEGPPSVMALWKNIQKNQGIDKPQESSALSKILDEVSSSSEESSSEEEASSSAASVDSEQCFVDACQTVLERYRTGTTNSDENVAPTANDVGALLRSKRKKKITVARRRSDTPTKPRKRASKLGEEKNKRPLTDAEKRTIGHWDTLPEYNHTLLLDGATCLWCNGRVHDVPYEPCVAMYTGGPDERVTPWLPTLEDTMGEHWLWGKTAMRPCLCRCHLGHSRHECYHDESRRHGSGFFPIKDIDDYYTTLRAPPPLRASTGHGAPEVHTAEEVMTLKHHQYGNYRYAVRDFHKAQNETSGQMTDVRMVLILSYSMRNNNFKKQAEQPRCPICKYVDTRGDRALTLCHYCRGSGYIKARWNVWRDLVIWREREIGQQRDKSRSPAAFREAMKSAMGDERKRQEERAERRKRRKEARLM